jgi:hypothetical protein
MIVRLAADSREVTTLVKLMPKEKRDEFRAALLDENRAVSRLFELDTAWHFHERGCEIHWAEQSHEPHHEFAAVCGGNAINIECKRIGLDSFRRIRRTDFYRFADALLPNIEKRNLCGKISVVVDDKLPHTASELTLFVESVLLLVEQEVPRGGHRIGNAHVDLQLVKRGNVIVDFQQCQNEFMARKPPEAHGVLFTYSCREHAADPVELTVKSQQADEVAKGIYDRVKGAVTRQLPTTGAGFVSIFVPEIEDFSTLAKEGGLREIGNKIFEKPYATHVAAITFVSDSRFTETFYGKHIDSPALIFANPRCRFSEWHGYPFLNEP